MSSCGEDAMNRMGRSGDLTEKAITALFAAALLMGILLTGCSVKPHELLGVETLFESETFESIEMETTEEETTTAAEETTEASAAL